MDATTVQQLTAPLFVSFVLQWLKNTSWLSWVRQDTPRLNRVLAVLGSLVATIGIHTNFDATTGVLTITGLTITGILHAAWAWLQTFILQEVAYQKIVRPANGG